MITLECLNTSELSGVRIPYESCYAAYRYIEAQKEYLERNGWTCCEPIKYPIEAGKLMFYRDKEVFLIMWKKT